MTETNSKAAWDRFTADAQNLAGELRRNYKDADDEKKAAEIDRSLRQLGQARQRVIRRSGPPPSKPRGRLALPSRRPSASLATRWTKRSGRKRLLGSGDEGRSP